MGIIQRLFYYVLGDVMFVKITKEEIKACVRCSRGQGRCRKHHYTEELYKCPTKMEAAYDRAYYFTPLLMEAFEDFLAKSKLILFFDIRAILSH